MDIVTGIVVFGHGSSVESANMAVGRVAADAAAKGGWPLYEVSFLECSPRLADAVAALVNRGAQEIVVVPYFLTLGIHLQRDLPKLIEELTAQYGIPIRVTAPLDGHPSLALMLVDRARSGA